MSNLNTKLRKRVQVNCTVKEKKVVQKHKMSCDINFIVEQYRKTGTFPSPLDRQAAYMDTTTIPDLATAMTIVHEAHQAFMELPAPLRKLMDNDPRRLESFITDQDNQELLKKYGVVESQKQPIQVPQSTEAPDKPEGASASKKAKSAPKTTDET